MATTQQGSDTDPDDATGGRSTDRARIDPFDPLDLGSYIRSQRERAKMSVRALAELANVSNPYLSQIERGLRRPSAEILQQVANALRVSVEQMYVRAGILPDVERTTSTVPEAIDGDPHLRPEQKLALRNVYDSFLAQAAVLAVDDEFDDEDADEDADDEFAEDEYVEDDEDEDGFDDEDDEDAFDDDDE